MGARRRREMPEWERLERGRTARYVLTSLAQGAAVNKQLTAIFSLGIGTVFKLAAASMRVVRDEARVAAPAASGAAERLEHPLDAAGNAFYLLAGANSVGDIVVEAFEALKGTPEAPPAYDVSDAPHTTSVSVSRGGGALDGPAFR